jgi:SHS2 domain-containing protein
VVWLNELISMFFAYKFLPAKYNIKITHDEPQYKVLEGALMGEQFNPYENKISREIKAATYHNLKIEKIDKKWQAEIIFDV